MIEWGISYNFTMKRTAHSDCYWFLFHHLTQDAAVGLLVGFVLEAKATFKTQKELKHREI
jgi:hypothetical protein